MRKTAAYLLLLTLAITPAAIANPSSSLEGVYVEARSAQVFIGGCIWNSEAMTIGREAVLAWRIDRGQIEGVNVSGLSVVAAIAGDENLAINPDGARRTVLYVDAAATTEQRDALTALYTDKHGRMFGEVVDVLAAPIEFVDTADGYRVAAGDDVTLEAESLHVDHKLFDKCGEAQWYEPFVPLQDSHLGVALENAYRGTVLNARWSDPHKQSAFFGHFSF